MFSPVNVNVGPYPGLHATAPVAYGSVNPRPDAASIQRSSTAIGSGPLFGESVSSGSGDGSLFQPNMSPDVVTVAVQLDTKYFVGGDDSLYVHGGTMILLGPSSSSKKKSSRREAKLGCVHYGILGGNVKVKVDSPGDVTFATVLVGPTTFYRNKVTYAAVAVQNVTRVRLPTCVGVAVKPGTRYEIVYDTTTQAARLTSDTSVLPKTGTVGREVTVVVQASPHDTELICDIGRVVWS